MPDSTTVASLITRKRLLLATGVAIGAVFLWLSFRGIDWQELWETLSSSRWELVPVFLLCLFLYYWVKAHRWAKLLSPTKRLKTSQLFPPLMIGYAVSSVLPLHLGEVARVLIVRRDHGVGASTLVTSIAVERLLDLVAIPLLFAIAILAGPEVPGVLVSTAYLVGLGGVFGLLLAFVVVMKSGLVMRTTEHMTTFLPERWKSLVMGQLAAAVEGARSVHDLRVFGEACLLTLLQWLMMWLCIWISITAVGIDVSWSASMLTVAMINIAVALPTSPGFVGSVQIAFVVALLPYAVGRELAVSASVFFHVLAYSSVVLSGLLFLKLSGGSLRAVVRSAEASNERAERPTVARET